MDLLARKYNFMEQIFAIKKAHVLDALERTLKEEREASGEISLANQKILDQRLADHAKNPSEGKSWEAVSGDLKAKYGI